MENKIGLVQDNKGNEYKVYPHRFISDIILISIKSIAVPIGCFAKDRDSDLIITWGDNEFEYLDILDKIECYLRKEEDKIQTIKDKSGYEIPIEILYTPVEFIAITKLHQTRALASAAINPVGEIIGYWIDADFRGSQSMKAHIGELFSNTLQHGLIITRNKMLFAKVHSGNLPAIKALNDFGFTEHKMIKDNGQEFIYTGQDIEKCLQIANELGNILVR